MAETRGCCVRLSRQRPLSRAAVLPISVAGVLGGVLISFVDARFAASVFAFLLGCAPLALLSHRRFGAGWALIALLGMLGALRAASVAREDPAYVSEPLPRQEIRAVVRSIRRVPGRGGTSSARLHVEVLAADGAARPVRDGEGVRLSIGTTNGPWELGDTVRFVASLRPVRGFCNGGRDDYARWLTRQGMKWTAWVPDDDALTRTAFEPDSTGASSLLRLRGRIGRVIDRSAGEPTAGILRALVLGDTGRLSFETRRAFGRSGTSHLLAVSGMHLGLVAAAAFFVAAAVLAVVPAWPASWPLARGAGPLSLVVASAYSVLAGGAVSTRRALVMLGFLLIGQVVRRGSSGWRALWAAIGVLVLADPFVLEDLSFQLSVVSVAALLGVAAAADESRWGGLLRARPEMPRGRWIQVWIARSVLASFAAGLATAPLVALYFGTVSVVGVVANLVIGPLVGVGALALGLAGALSVPVSESVALELFRGAAVLVDLGVGLAHAFAEFSWAAVDFDPGRAWIAVGLTFALVGFFVAPARSVWIAAGVGVACAVLPALGTPGGFRFAILDVGQGDALVVQSEAGGAWLIDAGGLGGSFDTGERVVLPALAARRSELRAIVLSHPDRDHYGGLRSVVEALRPAEFWWNGARSKAGGFAALWRQLEESGTHRRRLEAGTKIDASHDGLEIDVLHPRADARALSRNDGSLVLAVRFGATRILLTGDLEGRGERLLRRDARDLAATILKVPHHGSRSSSHRRLIEAVRPSVAVASLGAFNRFGFPAAEVVARYRTLGARWRETRTSGEIRVSSDGQLERVRTCRSRGGTVDRGGSSGSRPATMPSAASTAGSAV